MEYIIVENNSEKKETFEYYDRIQKEIAKVKVIYWKEKGFNYPAINNAGVVQSNGDYLLFLNNDTEIVNADCIEEMLGQCQRPEVGAVGARLYYEDGTIQHAGVIVGLGGVAGHAFVGYAHEDTGYCGRIALVQDYSAVTAACMMVERKVFEEVEGFDERYAVAFNDVDLCLKIRKAGYWIVYDPYAELNHYESKSRGMEDNEKKIKRFMGEIKKFHEKWFDILYNGDPYYNPNLSSRYYKETNGVYASYAYDMMGIDQANHCVTIVGWDDDFNNFSKDAPESGAWLIANSYGTNYSKDENGYFWVSYYDPSLCEYYTFEGVSADTYQTIFQYDGNGWNNSLRSPEEVKTANVYTADGSQQLQAVAFYTVQEDQPYTVDIYRSVSGKDPTNGTQIKEASVSGNFAKTGYHTVQIPKEVRVADGEKFSVVITYATVDDSACVPLEGQNDPQNGHCYSASAGQSYTYFAEDAKRYDNTAISVDGVQYDLNNACIKVFGNPADEPVATLTPTATPTVAPVVLPPTKPSTSGTPISTTKPSTSGAPTSTAAPSDATEQPKRTVSPNAGGRYQTKIKAKAKYTIGKGEKITLPVTVTGGSVQAAVKWTSSNTKVAKVTNNGVVKGCKRGTAKIVIQTVDGKKKTIRVTVKKAPKKIKITAQKAKIKKGKTLQTRTILSKGSASYKLRFVSSNKRIATVNSTGKIKAKRRGTVRIYVYTYNNKKSQIKIKIV